MISPADGLDETQLGLLTSIIRQVQEGGKGWATYSKINRNAFKSLCEFGVIGVATATYHHWQRSPITPFTTDGFVVWVTEKGHQYMRGEIDVAKPCMLDNRCWTPYGKCKRHKRYHLREEYESHNSTKVS